MRLRSAFIGLSYVRGSPEPPVPVLALLFRAFFIACGYVRLPDAASVPPGGLFDHVAVIRGPSIQAKVEENSVFMRLQGH